MPITVVWDDDEHTILRWDQESDFSVEEFREAYRLSHEMVAEIPGNYDLIITGSGGKMPVFPLSEMHRAFKNASPKQDLTLFVITDPIARGMIGMLQKMPMPIAKRIAFARSLEHARQIIADRRKELQCLKS